MPLLSQWRPNEPLQLLVYGPAKVGKTWGALTAPRPVVFDFDNGVATGRNLEFVQRYGVRWVYYENFVERGLKKGVPESHNAFDDACRFFDEWMNPTGGRWKEDVVGPDMFDTWVIDSGTTLTEFSQTKAVIVLGQMGGSTPLSKTHKDAKQYGVVIPKIQDYGAERSLTEQFVDMVRGSGKNVILICHEKELMNDAGATTAIVPLLTGKSAETIPLKFDEVYNLRLRKEVIDGKPGVVRFVQTQPDGIRKVGSRYGIPNGTAWEWDAIQKEMLRIRAAQVAQLPSEEKVHAAHQP